MTLKKQLLIVLVIALATLTVVWWLQKDEGPQKPRKKQSAPEIPVSIAKVSARPYTIVLESHGRLVPKVQAMLRSRVSGAVVFVSEQFRSGMAFSKNDKLLEIEKIDYEIAVAKAESDLLEAQYKYEEEKARVAEVKRTRKQFSNREEKPLALREPQLAFAEAAFQYAQAELLGAKKNLSRTDVMAPFTGRTITLQAELGEWVRAGDPLGEVYASDIFEVNLPIARKDLPFIQFDKTGNIVAHPVWVHPDGHNAQPYKGVLNRFNGAADSETGMMHLVAQLKSQENEQLINRVNIYVKARIEGVTLPNAIVIDNKAIYNNEFVYVYNDGVLRRQAVEVLWQNGSESVIAEGLIGGEQLIVTPIGNVTSGTRVKPIESVDQDTPK